MTKQQGKMLDFIRTYQLEHGGASPTLKEMSAVVGSDNHNVASYMLQKMIREGHIIKAGWRNYTFPAPTCCPNCGCNLVAA